MELRSVKYKGFEIWYNNQIEFEVLFDEIFTKQVYHFESKTQNPKIIDCGSHIGLSILYFKMLYPGSSIIAFEPNKESFDILKQNISVNNIQGVQLFNCALSDEEDEILFYKESMSNLDSCGDSIIPEWGKRFGFTTEKVQCKLLSGYLTNEIDFLKMDIEGAEIKVLETIKNKLHLVPEIALEYHIYNNESRDNLNVILGLLKDNYSEVSHSSFALGSIMPERYKDWVEQYEPVICNIRGKHVKN